MTTQMITTTGVRPDLPARDLARDPFAERDLAACDIRDAEVRHTGAGRATVTLTIDDLKRLALDARDSQALRRANRELHNELAQQDADQENEIATLEADHNTQLAQLQAEIARLSSAPPAPQKAAGRTLDGRTWNQMPEAVTR